MATTDTTPSTDLVTLDADSDETETSGFGSEVAKTLAISTATSAGVFGGFIVIALLTPKVKAWFQNRGKTDVIEGETVTDTPETDSSEKA